MKILWDIKIGGVSSFLSHSFQFLKINFKNNNKYSMFVHYFQKLKTIT
jgi:hypothetical protein